MSTSNQKPPVAVVGYGKVGRVLARAFHRAGYPVAGVVARRRPDDPWLSETGITVIEGIDGLPDEVGFLVLCVRDSQIEPLAGEVVARGGFMPQAVVAHTAGAVSAGPLEPVRRCGALPLAWHPLQTFTGDEGPELLEGITFGIDGDTAAVELGERVARDLGGIPFSVPPGMRPLYHLGGVFACNLMASLVGISQDLLKEVGMDEERSLRALGPLIKATASNIVRRGLPDAITGPLRRGDDRTIASHLETLKEYPEAAAAYRLLSRVLLECLGEVLNRERLNDILTD